MQLNYFPIHFDFERYQINTEPYTQERLAELRNLYNSTHSFFKNGDTIYISNKDGDESLVSGKIAERNTFGDNEVTASLIKHIFFRTFKDRFKQYTPVDFYPFRFFSGKEDMIKNALPEKLKDKISYKKLIEVQLRLTEINCVKRFGFLINIRRNWIFNISCSELNAEGFDLKGLDVLHAETLPGLTNILAPNEEFVGVLKEVTGTKAKVETNEGLKEFELKELFIRKTKFNIGNYLSFANSQQKSDEILSIIETKRSDIYNPKSLYAEIAKIAEHLFTENGQPVLFQNKDSFCFTVDSKPLVMENSIDLKAPTFIFDYAATKKHTSADRGMTNYGPYDSSTFDTKSPRALCICHKNNRGHFTNFLSQLKDGIPDSSWFQKGLIRKYDLQDLLIDVKEIDEYTLEEYLNTISNYDQFKPDLAIIEIPASFRNLPDTVNPYFRLKAKLLSSEIPVQFVTAEKVRNINENILNFIGLQIYAKLGGVPWVLPTQPSVDREIIIGIGHSYLRQNQYAGAKQNRVVGITTFFSGDGQYLLSDKVKDVAYENYFAELLKSLKQSIDFISKTHGWTNGETVRLIFHIFKPIKNTEFEVVSQLVKEIEQYKIKFAFITISDTHPNILFDINQPGVQKFGKTIGAFIPNRASNIILDDETCIVQMFGANELKTSKHGMSKPIQIRIRRPQGNYSNNELDALIYHDLRYITQQIYSFSYLTWRSFLPGAEPATMKYSNLISKLLGKLRSVQGWDADKLNYGLKKKEMVSIENKISYLSRIGDSPKLSAFNQLLTGKAIAQPIGNDLSETDEIFFGIISAIQANDKSAFDKHYSKKSKSNPSKESPAPFVNDDFLIFSIILGVTKFNIDKAWIKSIVSIRSKNSITTTLDNLLTDNYYSTSNLPEIVLMFLQDSNQNLITNDFLNSTFKKINENTALLESKSDFQILCAIHAYNSIILVKEAPEGSEIQLLKSFDSKFVKRMKVFSWVMQLLILAGIIYGLLKLPKYSPQTVDLIDDYGFAFTILGALGFTFFGNLLGFIRRKTHELTMRLFGYPKGLIKNNKENK